MLCLHVRAKDATTTASLQYAKDVANPDEFDDGDDLGLEEQLGTVAVSVSSFRVISGDQTECLQPLEAIQKQLGTVTVSVEFEGVQWWVDANCTGVGERAGHEEGALWERKRNEVSKASVRAAAK